MESSNGNRRGWERAGPVLRRLVHHVGEVALGERTSFQDGRLTVDAGEAGRLLADPALAATRVDWVSPGERARIVGVLDAVEPRAKGAGGGTVFPGFLGPPLPQGSGDTHVLRGTAVVAAGFLPRAQEAVIEMSGDAAALGPLGSCHNLVVEFEPAEDADWREVDAALRRGMLRLAAHLAGAAREAEPDEVHALPDREPADGRPVLGIITNLQTQGAFKDVFVYGESLSAGLPTPISPNELEDGAVVSGQYGHPALRNPTYLHQNHPLVAAVRERDDAVLGGMILSPEPVQERRKELVSAHAARLCALAGFDAVVVTKEGGGNADADVALKLDALEALGIPAIGIFAEMSGPEGTGPPLVVAPTRATALVSTGNYDERLSLPACERALGRPRVDLLDVEATAELELPVAALHCALNPLGHGRLTAEAVA